MSWYGGGYGDFAPYVPVAKRRANALRHALKLAKKEKRPLDPVSITGRAMATTFWGQAWCENLEAYSDYASRLPRGRTYARNGSVVDLRIKQGKIEAIVAGSEVYTITISIETLSQPLWTRLKSECSSSIASLIDLLRGRFDDGVMQRLAHPTDGLFPRPKEIKMKCSCPDSAGLCKHLAAVLYGVGNRLDKSPELLFTLRKVDHLELVNQAVAAGNLERSLAAGDDNSLAGSDLGAMFGIELDQAPTAPKAVTAVKQKTKAKTVNKAPTKNQSKTQVKTQNKTQTKTLPKTKPQPAQPAVALRKTSRKTLVQAIVPPSKATKPPRVKIPVVSITKRKKAR